MIKFKKVSNFWILCAVITGLLFTASAYSYYPPEETLRLPVGQEDDTFIRVQALFIKAAFQSHPKEQAYILDPKHTTLLLVALGIKPAYWTWTHKMTVSEFNIVKNISEILGLRFVPYNRFIRLGFVPERSIAHASCFIYNPKALAMVFLQHGQELLSPDFYLGRNINKRTCLEAFKRIDLERIISGEGSDDTIEQLINLDNYLIAVSQLRQMSTTDRDVSPEPFPIGLAMGYDILDVKEYFRARKDMVKPYEYLDLIISDTHDIMIASRDFATGLSIFTGWIKARDKAQLIIDDTMPLAPFGFRHTARNIYCSL